MEAENMCRLTWSAMVINKSLLFMETSAVVATASAARLKSSALGAEPASHSQRR